MKTNFNTLAEMEQILRDKLNMVDYWIEYNEQDQPTHLKVETSTHKIRRAKAATSSKYGHLQFNLSVRKDGKKSVIHFLVHRVVFLLENPTCNISGLVIDHINHCPTDNRIQNLQAITNRENLTKDKVITPIITNHTVEYCQAKLNAFEEEYSTYLATHPDISHNVYKNPELNSLASKVSKWKARLAYATLNNQYEFKVKELF